ncbi:MAG: D-aminoacylase [Gemmatimonadaceae bacterium]|nr:D-aminoacylase [Gemmatimonadaceae bacterium]
MSSSRREFVVSTSSAALMACAPFFQRRSATVDVIIRGGTVFDGSLSATGIEADVALDAGRVVAIGRRLKERGRLEVDAKGLAVAPGFVDVHSHGDGSLFADPNAESVIRQGVTTIVVGQDGSSRGPRARADEDSDRESLRAFFDALDMLPPAVNVASMVGLGTVRGAVMGNENREATPAELERMVALVERSLAEGACGASTGLEYTPGAFAPLSELVALSRPLARRRLPYSTHMRNEDDRLLESIDESIAVARGAGCPLQIAHLKTQGPRNWPKLDAVFAKVAAARADGIDAAFDRYPYLAYQTGLSNLFPVWARDGAAEDFLRRLDEPATAERIRLYAEERAALIGGWHNVQIASVSAADDKRFEGMRLDDVARARGLAPYETAMALLKANRASVGMVGFAMSEENLERILAHPQAMVCSDGGSLATSGPARAGHPHPRGAGSFARVLARYVRERKVLTLGAAIHKMSALSAQRLRLAGRGVLRAGAAGDAVVFDPATVADTATFDNPFQYAVGVKAVFVNAGMALLDGERGTRTGRALRVVG